uniref:Sugar phosphate isomerases/epimerases n=1 Tax=uncultured Armatimonadetes bacterium TaxID=157466 RepID=A0A6J4JZG4_9BACT|nr:Sugar phosphate isomerases/epimerases [uncultured Armatimonadetes bacterium]
MASKLAVQMYTIRDHTRTARALADSLARVRAIGYTAVQLSAVGAMSGDRPEVDAREARRMLDDNGLACIATHRGWEALAERTDEEIDFHRTLGCTFTAIGGIPGSYGERGAEGYAAFVRDAAPVIARLKAAGIRWGYHNHAHEFQRLDDPAGPERRTRYDLFIEDGGADFLLEVDVYWAWHAGIDPVRLMQRGAGRVPVIHLKDKEVVAKEGPVIAAIGEGNLPWDTILPACESAGVAWYAVEQDVCRRDPFDCLRASYDFLSAQGL